MKHKLYFVLGDDFSNIVKNMEPENFFKLVNEIYEYSFNSIEEKDAFLKGLDVGIGYNSYQVIEADIVDIIMEYGNED